MLLDLVAHFVLEVPDDLVAQVREDRLPGILKRVLNLQLPEPPIAVPLGAAGEERVFIAPLRLRKVEWRSDLALRLLAQVRDAVTASAAIGLGEVYDEAPSVLDRRRR